MPLSRANKTGLPRGRSPLELVQWLTGRTRRGLTIWQRKRELLTANVGTFAIHFLVVESTTGVETWRFFQVRDARGIELLRTTPLLVGATKPELETALDGLFTAATKPLGKSTSA